MKNQKCECLIYKPYHVTYRNDIKKKKTKCW